MPVAPGPVVGLVVATPGLTSTPQAVLEHPVKETQVVSGNQQIRKVAAAVVVKVVQAALLLVLSAVALAASV